MDNLLVSTDSAVCSAPAPFQGRDSANSGLFSSALLKEMAQDTEVSESNTSPAAAPAKSGPSLKQTAGLSESASVGLVTTGAPTRAGLSLLPDAEQPEADPHSAAAVDTTGLLPYPLLITPVPTETGLANAGQDAELNESTLNDACMVAADTSAVLTSPQSLLNTQVDAQLKGAAGADSRTGTTAATIQLQHTDTPATAQLQTLLNQYSQQASDKLTQASPLAAASVAQDGKLLPQGGATLPARNKPNTDTASTAASIANGLQKNQPGQLSEILSGLLQGDAAASDKTSSTLELIPQRVTAPELDTGKLALAGPASHTRDTSPASTLNPLTDSAATARANAPFLLGTQIPAGSAGWGEEIGSHINWLSNHKISKAEISLHPAELGALDITINTEDDRISVSIVTRNDAARELLESSLPKLSELLRNNGLTLEQGSVSQQHTAHGRDGHTASAHSGFKHDADRETQEVQPLHMRTALLHDGQIDHYV